MKWAAMEDPPEKKKTREDPNRTGSLLDMYKEILEENVMFEDQAKS